jgi:hypothetical protein
VKATLISLEDGVKVPRVGELSAIVDGVKAEELEDTVPEPLALLAVTVHV